MVRPSSTQNKDKVELVLGKGSKEEDLLMLTDKLCGISGAHEVDSSLDGST